MFHQTSIHARTYIQAADLHCFAITNYMLQSLHCIHKTTEIICPWLYLVETILLFRCCTLEQSWEVNVTAWPSSHYMRLCSSLCHFSFITLFVGSPFHIHFLQLLQLLDALHFSLPCDWNIDRCPTPCSSFPFCLRKHYRRYATSNAVGASDCSSPQQCLTDTVSPCH
jgi:hypothetical protein